MAIALGLDPAWTTGTATSIVSAAFSPVANSLIIVESHVDDTTSPTITDSVGLTWTAIGTPQAASTGGRAAAWWAFTASARTNMTVTINWSSAANKAIKVKTWIGTASTSAVISKLQSTATTTPLNLGVTTTNDGCRISGSALDWNARGGPTSSDDEISYTVTGAISGTSVHKAANSSGVGTSVTLNIVKGTVAPQAADWAYKVWEIVPAPPVGVRELLRGSATNVDIVLTTGAGTAVNDLLVVIHATDGLTTSDMVSPTAGSWTQQTVADIGSGNSHLKVWTRPVASAGAQSVTVPKVGSADHGAHLYVITGANTASPVDGATGTTGAASTSHVAPSISPATANTLLLSAAVSEVFSFGNYTAVSGGMTDLTEDDLTPSSTFSTLVSARQNLAASGATGTRTFTYSQSKAFAAVSVAIKAAGGGGGASVTTATATATLLAVPVTPISQPVTLTLTPATTTSAAPSATVTPGAVNITLTPVVTTLSAPSVDVIVPGTPWVRNSTQSGTGAGTAGTHSVAIPTCQVGDDLWASFTLNAGYVAVTAEPAGWTRIFPTTITDDNITMTLLVYRKAATSSEVAGGNVSLTVSTAVRGNAGAVAVAGADTGALGGSTSSSGTGGTATTATSFSTTTANTLVLSILALDSGAEVATSPALTIERWNPTRTVTGQANAGATAMKSDTTPASWNWSWSTPLTWKTWVGAIRPVSTTSSVTLTPAVMTTTAPTVVTATPQPGVVTLTPVTRTITAVAVTATPQPVIITLSPAVTTTAAVVLNVGGVGGTTLTPAIFTATASSVIATPGAVTKTLTSASTTMAAIPLSVTPLAVTITLTPAVMTMTALGVGLGAVGAATLTPAQLTTSARTLTVTPGPTSVTLTTATITFAVPAVIATPGAININISVAQATILLNPVSFSAVPTSAVTLAPAQLTLSTFSGVYVTKPGVDLMTIAFATVTGVGEYIRGELADTEGGVPERFALIVPGSIAWDNCDCGQFAQSITSVVSSRVFPTPASDQPVESCGHPQAVVSVTLSLVRCVPTVDDNGNAPSVNKLLAAARVIEDDRQTLRRALACHMRELYRAYKILNYTIGNAQSVGPEGMCGGVEINYSFGIHNDAMCC